MDKVIALCHFIFVADHHTVRVSLQERNSHDVEFLEYVHSTKRAGKVAVVTCGNFGTGSATAIRFAREGALVCITGGRQAELDTALTAIGPIAAAVRNGIASAADHTCVVKIVSANTGRIDILFANAGGGEFALLDSITRAQFDKTFDNKVTALSTRNLIEKSMQEGSKNKLIQQMKLHFNRENEND